MPSLWVTEPTGHLVPLERDGYATASDFRGQGVVDATAQLVAGAVERGARVSIGTSIRSPGLFLNLDANGTGRTIGPSLSIPCQASSCCTCGRTLRSRIRRCVPSSSSA